MRVSFLQGGFGCLEPSRHFWSSRCYAVMFFSVYIAYFFMTNGIRMFLVTLRNFSVIVMIAWLCEVEVVELDARRCDFGLQ
jgi:hypothetical protein